MGRSPGTSPTITGMGKASRTRAQWLRMWLVPWPYRVPQKGASQPWLARAKEAAKGHETSEVLSNLSATESDVDCQLLYEYCRHNQIRPDYMWRMRRVDLAYIAGHQGHQDLTEEERTKLLGNATRARLELERRDRRSIAALSAIIGALGALATLIAGGII
jgi:hypothetical protein